MATLLDRIRDAVTQSGESRYSIAKGSGVSAAQLSRLVNRERGLDVATMETLADYLGLEIVIRPKRRKSAARKDGAK